MEKIKRDYKGPLVDIVLDKLDEIVDWANDIDKEFKIIEAFIIGLEK